MEPSSPPAQGTRPARSEAFWIRAGLPTLPPHEMAQTLVSGARDFAIFSTDAQGLILSWNPGAQRLTGYRAEDVVGRDFEILWTPEDIAARLPYLELEEAATQGRAEIDNWVRRRDGSKFWATGACRALLDAEGGVQGFVKVLRDTTRRREAEMELRRDHERLKHFQSLVVHELRNPVSPMLLQLRILEQSGLDERQGRSVAVLERNLWRIKRLCDDLADAAHLQLGKFPIEAQSTDVARLVHEAAEASLGQAAQSHVTLEVDAPPSLAAHADPHRVAQVLSNLIANALRVTPAQGTLSIKAQQCAAREPGQSGSARIEVRDSGIGMTPQQIAQLFQPFTQVEPTNTAGMGLGLYLSKAIVKGHGGDIWAESRGPGLGSSFVFELPLAPPLASPPVSRGELHGNGATGATVRAALATARVPYLRPEGAPHEHPNGSRSP